MAALNATATRKGHRAMEKAITAAARVRRQLKAGRPRTARSLTLNAYEVMGILVSQADRASSLMREARLNPKDIKLRLIIRAQEGMLLKRLPPPGETQPFFQAVESMAGAQFLGILWEQTDREAEAGKPPVTYWVTPFVADAESQRQMEALMNFISAGGTRVLAD